MQAQANAYKWLLLRLSFYVLVVSIEAQCVANMESFLDSSIFLYSSQQKRMSASASQKVFQERDPTGWGHGELQQEQCGYLHAYQIDPTAL